MKISKPIFFMGFCLFAYAKECFPDPVAASEYIPFDAAHWNLKDASVTEVDGRQAIKGSAKLLDTAFEDGVIEVDIKTKAERSFPGISFRDDGLGNSEEIYIRPHHSGAYDALQYAPAWNGQTAWQLYHGEGYTAPVQIPLDTWVTLRVEVRGSNANVYFNDKKIPALIIGSLKGKSGAGGITISTTKSKDVYLSNFRISKTENFVFSAPTTPRPVKNIITDWKISPMFSFNKDTVEIYPKDTLANSIQWRTVEPEVSGLVNVSRYLSLTDGKPGGTYARTVIHSPKKQRVKILFGYSDNVTIFYNRKPIFSGTAEFRSREPGFTGLIGYNDAIHLELQRGNNEILLALTEVFGGWGFQMRMENTTDN